MAVKDTEQQIAALVKRYGTATTDTARDGLAKELSRLQEQHSWIGRATDSTTRGAWRASLKRLVLQRESLAVVKVGLLSKLAHTEKLAEIDRHIAAYEDRIRRAEAVEDAE